MRKIVVGTFLSLDGVYQGPGSPEEDPEGGFKDGGWQLPFFDEDAGRYIGESYAATDGLLLGRVTYEIFAGFWPTAPAEDPFAAQMNSMPKYVVSKTLKEVTWNNSRLIKGNLVEGVSKLKKEPGSGHIAVVGSGKLAQSLMRLNLVDEFELWVHPVVLGSGKQLFDGGVPKTPLRLVNTRTTGSGIVILTYQPAQRE